MNQWKKREIIAVMEEDEVHLKESWRKEDTLVDHYVDSFLRDPYFIFRKHAPSWSYSIFLAKTMACAQCVSGLKWFAQNFVTSSTLSCGGNSLKSKEYEHRTKLTKSFDA